MFPWREDSTFLKRPPFFDELSKELPSPHRITGMWPLAILGDMVTTDHLSPINIIAADSPAGRYLKELGITENNFQTYGFRRGNHDLALRGTFASTRLKNDMTPGLEGPSIS